MDKLCDEQLRRAQKVVYKIKVGWNYLKIFSEALIYYLI